MIAESVAFCLVVALTAVAGWGVVRRTAPGAVAAEHRIAAALLAGVLLVAAGTFAGAAGGHPVAGAAAAVVAGLALVGRAGAVELRQALAVSGRRWIGWVLVAVVWPAAHQGRMIDLGDAAVSWRGTTGWETWSHVVLSRTISAGPPFHPLGPWPAARLNYHLADPAAALGFAGLSGADVVAVHARLLPPVLFALAFEAHRSFLRTWFPAGRAIVLAALLPALVGDLDLPLRAIGLRPVPEFEHRLAHSFVASPSFALGQAHALLVLGAIVRAARDGRLAPRLAVAAGAALGLVVASKLPSFVLAAVGVAAIAPWIARRQGARAVAWGVAGVAVGAAVATAACFPDLVTGGTGDYVARPALWAPFHPFDPERSGIAGAGGVAALALLWLVQALGPRALRLGRMLGDARSDGSILVVLAPLAAGIVAPLLVRLPPGEEQKYLLRCGAEAALLVVGAHVATDLLARRRRAFAEAAVIAVFCAGTAWYARGGPWEGRLTAAEIGAVRRAGADGLPVVADPSLPTPLAIAVSALSGTAVRRPADVAGVSPAARVTAPGAALAPGRHVVLDGPSIRVVEGR